MLVLLKCRLVTTRHAMTRWHCVQTDRQTDTESISLQQLKASTAIWLTIQAQLKTPLFTLCFNDWFYYRAMHFSAKRGIAIACRLSVCLSVTLVNCDHIGWNSSKIISSLVSLGCSLFATPIRRVCSKGNTPKFWTKVTHPLLIWASETFNRKLRPNGYR